MSRTLIHKGYTGSAEVDFDAGIIFGRVVGLRTVITFEAESIDQARVEFVESVENDLESCARRGVDPEKPHSGKLVVRLGSELHRELAAEASRQGLSLNQVVVGALAARLSGEDGGLGATSPDRALGEQIR